MAAPIHATAMPVLQMTAEDVDVWQETLKLRKLQPDDALVITEGLVAMCARPQHRQAGQVGGADPAPTGCALFLGVSLRLDLGGLLLNKFHVLDGASSILSERQACGGARKAVGLVALVKSNLEKVRHGTHRRLLPSCTTNLSNLISGDGIESRFFRRVTASTQASCVVCRVTWETTFDAR